MAKKKEIKRIAKLEFNAGQAKPGPELAGLGIVMPEFTRQFNDETRDRGSEPVPVTITVYSDKSFSYKTHTSPAAYKLKEAAKIKSGSANAKTTKVATISVDKLREIAEYKMPDMNTTSVDSAMRTVAGTAKNMGILIDGFDDLAAEQAKAKEAAKADADAAKKAAALEAAEKENVENKDKEIEVVATNQKSDEEGGN